MTARALHKCSRVCGGLFNANIILTKRTWRAREGKERRVGWKEGSFVRGRRAGGESESRISAWHAKKKKKKRRGGNQVARTKSARVRAIKTDMFEELCPGVQPAKAIMCVYCICHKMK